MANDGGRATTENAPPTEQRLDPRTRLWFDYVSKLNDRDLQLSRASGATNWVLLAVVAAILYRGVPAFTTALDIPKFFGNTIILLLLEVDTAAFYLCFLIFLMYYCGGDLEARLIPALRRRALSIHKVAVALLSVLVVIGHFWSYWHIGQDAFARRVVMGFGLLWLGNIVTSASKLAVRRYRRRKHGASAPDLTTLSFPSEAGLIVSLVCFGLGTLSGMTMIHLTGHEVVSGVNWLIPLSASTQILVLGAISYILFYRALESASRGVYQQLEREIVYLELSPTEIRKRFTERIVGKDFAEWLGEFQTQYDTVRGSVADMLRKAKLELDDIEQIDNKYTLERRGRAQKVADQVAAELLNLKGILSRTRAQIPSTVALPTWQRELVNQVGERSLQALKDLDAELNRHDEVLGRLSKLLGEEQGVGSS